MKELLANIVAFLSCRSTSTSPSFFYQVVYATPMSIEVLSSLICNFFLSFHVSRFSFYINKSFYLKQVYILIITLISRREGGFLSTFHNFLRPSCADTTDLENQQNYEPLQFRLYISKTLMIYRPIFLKTFPPIFDC